MKLSSIAFCLALTAATGQSFAGQILLDEFEDSTVGNASGIQYVAAKNGKGAQFSRINGSRIQYGFGTQIPTQGTIELQIYVESGYNYTNYTLNEGNTHALIFTTDIQGGDVTWPGSTWVFVNNNGDIRFHIAGEKYEAGHDPKYVLEAKATSFRFNEWHTIGLSYGDQGRHIMIDGKLVATNVTQTQSLGRGGNHSQPVDIPTIGESVSGFWSSNQWEGGFVGIVDRFRTSSTQKDWVVSAPPPSASINGVVRGLKAGGFSVKCVNLTTKAEVTLTTLKFDCTDAGLDYLPNHQIQMIVNGKAK